MKTQRGKLEFKLTRFFKRIKCFLSYLIKELKIVLKLMNTEIIEYSNPHGHLGAVKLAWLSS